LFASADDIGDRLNTVGGHGLEELAERVAQRPKRRDHIEPAAVPAIQQPDDGVAGVRTEDFGPRKSRHHSLDHGGAVIGHDQPPRIRGKVGGDTAGAATEFHDRQIGRGFSVVAM
jgi:hypothetical protein